MRQALVLLLLLLFSLFFRLAGQQRTKGCHNEQAADDQDPIAHNIHYGHLRLAEYIRTKPIVALFVPIDLYLHLISRLYLTVIGFFSSKCLSVYGIL